MTVSRRLGIACIALLLMTGCREDGEDTPLTPPDSTDVKPPLINSEIFQRSISDPIETSEIVVGSAGASGTVYVAFSEGDLPDARTVQINNLTTRKAGVTVYELLNGALDPVSIAAAAGDTLELRITKLDGTIASMRAAVPAKRPPRVIRTNPPRGRTDVALNSRIRVVFSEPVEGGSINASTMRLLQGDQLIAGSFQLDEPVLAAEFIPADPLASGSTYTLMVGSGIRDLSGDALAEPVTVEFRTVDADPASGNLLITVETSGFDQDSDGYEALIEKAGYLSRDTLSLEGVLTKTLPAGSYTVTLVNVARNCIVPGGARKYVDLAAAANLSVSYEVLCSPVAGQPISNQAILFVSERSGNSDIYAAHPTGSGIVRLTFNSANDMDPAWSPDGRRIAFVSDRTGFPEIYIMDADGSHLVRRTTTGYARAPAWSPDGSKIAFETICGERFCVKVISANDDSNVNLELGQPFYFNGQPSWSPDGSEIAFISDWDASDFVYDIFVTKVDGSATRQLTKGFGFEPSRRGEQIRIKWYLHPEYSHDGKIAVLFYEAHFGTRDQPPLLEAVKIAVMNNDGTAFTVVADAGETSRFATYWPPSLTWSPDGTRIAFTFGVCTGPEGENCAYSIGIAHADGSAQQTVLADAHSPSWR